MNHWERHTNLFFTSSSCIGDEQKQGSRKKRLKTYRYKYQGQERQDELNLNWDSFKWRNYDYTIGRFFNVDPLSEKYPQFGNYVFSGNLVTAGREQEGLEPYAPYGSLQAAVENFGQQYNGVSVLNNVEIGTTFYSTTDSSGNTTYSYVQPGGLMFYNSEGVRVDNDTVNYDGDELVPEGSTAEAGGHTHGWDKSGEGRGGVTASDSNSMSGGDIDTASKHKKRPEYVITPNGSIFVYKPHRPGAERNAKTKGEAPINTSMPSDPNSPTRKNEVSPSVTPEVMPTLEYDTQGMFSDKNGKVNPNKVITTYDPNKQTNDKLPKREEISQ